MQATTQAKESINRIKQKIEYDDVDCSVISKTYNARIVTSTKNPKSSFTLAYPAVMVIYDIHKRVLQDNTTVTESYIPNVLSLEPKIQYTLPRLGYDYPFTLIECLEPNYIKDSDENAPPYAVEKITVSKDVKKINAAVEERFAIAGPKGSFLFYESSNNSPKIVKSLNGNISSNSLKKMPIVWKLQRGQNYVICNLLKIDQIFHLVTIHQISPKI